MDYKLTKKENDTQKIKQLCFELKSNNQLNDYIESKFVLISLERVRSIKLWQNWIKINKVEDPYHQFCDFMKFLHISNQKKFGLLMYDILASVLNRNNKRINYSNIIKRLKQSGYAIIADAISKDYFSFIDDEDDYNESFPALEPIVQYSTMHQR